MHDAVDEVWASLCAADDAGRPALLRQELQRQLGAQLPFVDAADPQVDARIRRQVAAFLDLVDTMVRADPRVGEQGDPWSWPAPQFEQYLEGELAGLPLHGYADIAWPRRIVDIKTGGADGKAVELSADGLTLMKPATARRPAAPADNERTGAALQVGLYAALAQSPLPDEELRGEFWFVKPGDAGVVALTMPGGQPREQDWRHRAFARLREGVDRGLFPAVGDPGDSFDPVCRYCDFRVLCGPGTGERWSEIEGDAQFAAVVHTPADAEGQP